MTSAASDAFDDLLTANRRYAAGFVAAGLDHITRDTDRALAVVTCMDARIEPLAVLGLAPGDAKVVRNPGARVTDEVLRALVLATTLLGVTRVLVLAHTDCALHQPDDAALHRRIAARTGLDTSTLPFGAIADPLATLRADVARIRAYPLLPRGVTAGGAVYDVTTGIVTPAAD